MCRFFVKANCLYIIQVVLGILILVFSFLYTFVNSLSGFAVMIVASFGLLALSMNYRYDEENKKETIKTRNAWDVWFFSMPGAIIGLIFVGILANNSEVWKWVAIAMGGAVGLESLSSLIKNLKS